MKSVIHILIITAGIIWGQKIDSTGINENNSFVNDGNHLLMSAYKTGSAPWRWENNDWNKAGIYTGIIIVSTWADLPFKEFSQDKRSAKLDPYFQIDDYYGTGYMLMLSGGIYLGGILGKNPKVRRLGLKTFEAFIYSGLIANLIKPVIGRGRPFLNEGNYSFQPFTLDNDYHSIPSGHTTVAFAFSAVMAKEVDNLLWDSFWYGLAAWTAAARIYHNQHWFSDTVAGGFLGFTIGSFIADIDGPNRYEKNKIEAFLAPGGLGIRYYLY